MMAYWNAYHRTYEYKKPCGLPRQYSPGNAQDVVPVRSSSSYNFRYTRLKYYVFLGALQWKIPLLRSCLEAVLRTDMSLD